jgi:hypothetical protein
VPSRSGLWSVDSCVCGGKPARLAVVATAASGVLALPLLCLGLHLPVVFVAAAAVVTGVGLDVAIVTWSTALGQHIPDALQGRVQSVNSIGELSAVPVGYLVTAMLAPHISLYAVTMVGGAGIMAATALNLCVRSLWAVKRLA